MSRIGKSALRPQDADVGQRAVPPKGTDIGEQKLGTLERGEVSPRAVYVPDDHIPLASGPIERLLKTRIW